MASFKSYATPGSFNPFKVPDEAQKIKDDANEKIKLMERDLKLLQENQQVESNLRQEGRQLEDSSRQSSFQFDSEMRGQYRDQIVRNYETELDNIEKKRKSQQQSLELVKGFSQTAFDTIGAYKEARNKGMQEAYALAVYDTGITAAEAAEIMKLDLNMSNSDFSRNQLVQQLAERGVSMEQIRFLQKTGGSDRYLQSKALLEQTVAQFPGQIDMRGNEVFELPSGGSMSLNQALERGDTNAYQFISKKLTTEFIRSSGLAQLNPQLVGTMAYPRINQYWSDFGAKVGAASRKQAISSAKARRLDNLTLKLNSPGNIANVWNTLAGKTGFERTQALDDIFTFLQNGAATGQVNQDMINWLSQQDAGDGLTVEQRFSTGPRAEQWNGIRKNIQEFRSNQISQQDLIQKENKIVARDQVNALLNSDVEITDANIEALQQEQLKTLGVVDPRLENLETLDDRVNDAQNAEAQFRLETGTLTQDWLYSTNNLELINKWKGITNAVGSPQATAAVAQYNKELELLAASPDQLITAGSTELAAKGKLSASMMARELKQKFNDKYLGFLRAGATPEEAAQTAFDLVRKEFDETYRGPDSASRFNTNNEYVEFAITDKESANLNRQAVDMLENEIRIKKAVDEIGADALNQQGTIYASQDAVERASNGFGKPGWRPDAAAVYAAQGLGTNPLAVLNRQRIAYGLKPLEMPPSMQSVSENVTPAMRTFLNNYPTPDRSTRALGSSGVFDPRLVSNGYGNIVQQAANSEGFFPGYLAAIGDTENRGVWRNNLVSSAGAVGVMQIVPEYHPGYDPNSGDEGNIAYAAQYYGQLLRQFGDPVAAAAAYNMGPGAYQEYLEGRRSMPAETQEYIRLFQKNLYKYGDRSQLRSPGTMRRGAAATFAPLTNFAPQVSSIVMEREDGQPGMDIFFEDKQFPAVLPGVVKEIGSQGNQSAGYGNYIIIESIDPNTGQKVDVLYAHLAQPSNLLEGSEIAPGMIIGTQGGTGSVRSADGTIASIDFLAPAPKGSKSMTPYENFRQLRTSIAQQLRN